MDVARMTESEARAEQRLTVHMWIAGVCLLLAMVSGSSIISAQSNPLAQTPTLAPVAGQIAKTEVDMCAYRTGAVLGIGGTCGAGVKFWIAGSSDALVATTRAAPMLQPQFIQPGGYAMGMVAPASFGGAREAYMLSVDGNPIVQYGSVGAPNRSADALAFMLLLGVPVLLFPVHLMMRRAARARAETRVSRAATWGQS
ncbi:MAG: hypothetical protein SGJ23_06070 [Alphaproteobacteria bacterium]|nr:hypothetical protein [Alphaproteobacteria bacterium]